MVFIKHLLVQQAAPGPRHCLEAMRQLELERVLLPALI